MGGGLLKFKIKNIRFLVKNCCIKTFAYFNCTFSLGLRPKIYDILNFNFFSKRRNFYGGGARQILTFQTPLLWVLNYFPLRGFMRISWTNKTAERAENCCFALGFTPAGEFVGQIKTRGVFHLTYGK